MRDSAFLSCQLSSISKLPVLFCIRAIQTNRVCSVLTKVPATKYLKRDFFFFQTSVFGKPNYVLLFSLYSRSAFWNTH